MGRERSGRKKGYKEWEIVEGFKELSPLYFKVVKKLLNSDIKTDQIEGAKLIKGGMEKFIPTVIAGDKENPIEIIYKDEQIKKAANEIYDRTNRGVGSVGEKAPD